MQCCSIRKPIDYHKIDIEELGPLENVKMLSSNPKCTFISKLNFHVSTQSFIGASGFVLTQNTYVILYSFRSRNLIHALCLNAGVKNALFSFRFPHFLTGPGVTPAAGSKWVVYIYTKNYNKLSRKPRPNFKLASRVNEWLPDFTT